MRQAPNKVFVSVAILIVVIGVSLAYKYRTTPESISGNVSIISTEENLPKTFAEDDKDSDGLMDWEEILWRTDPNNPDTDGDGTSDGEEVLLSRNPTLAGPDDSLSSFRFPKTETSNTEPSTATESFARILFSQLIQSEDNLSAEQLSQQLLYDVDSLPPRANYTVSNLKVVYDNTNTAAHAYGNAIGAILVQNAPGTENEVVILERFVTGQKTVDRVDLEKIVISYNANRSALLKANVPSNIAQAHLDMILGFDSIAEDITSLLDIHNDPITVFPYLNRYSDDALLLTGGLGSISDWLQNTTSFANNESGYTFVEAF